MVTVSFTVIRNWEPEKKVWDAQETYQVTATSPEQAERIARCRCEKSERWELNEIKDSVSRLVTESTNTG